MVLPSWLLFQNLDELSHQEKHEYARFRCFYAAILGRNPRSVNTAKAEVQLLIVQLYSLSTRKVQYAEQYSA